MTGTLAGPGRQIAAALVAAVYLALPMSAAAQSFKPPQGTSPAPVRGGMHKTPTQGVQPAGYLEPDAGESIASPQPVPQPQPLVGDGEPMPQEPYDHELQMDVDYGCGRGLWVRAEYLNWWTKGFATPPLVTTSPVGTARTDAGVLGLPTTAVLYGGDNLPNEFQPGGQVRIGYWVDPCEAMGIEAAYFGLGSVGSSFSASNQQFPILARPFLNLDPANVGNDAELVAFPNLFSGSINVSSDTQLQGSELQVRRALCGDCFCRIDWVAGWRYTQLNENLRISDGRTVLSSDSGLTVGTTLGEFDQFKTQNIFNGAQIGFVTETRRCCVWVETRMTVALGNNHTQTNISGQTITTTPATAGAAQTVVTPHGLLALPTNVGSYSDDNFAVIPQLGVTLGWDITCNLRATLGYTFMYWSQVVRPGDQIDPELNLSQIAPGGLVGVARPLYPGALSDFWAQGLNVGLNYRF